MGRKKRQKKGARKKREKSRKHATGVLTRKTNPEKTQLVFGKIREMHKTEKKTQNETKQKQKKKKSSERNTAEKKRRCGEMQSHVHADARAPGHPGLGREVYICFWKENESFLMIALSDGNSCTRTHTRKRREGERK